MVIPAYNEESNIDRVYERISEVLSGLDVELIFSVDSSTDETEHRILALRAHDPRVILLFRARVFHPSAVVEELP